MVSVGMILGAWVWGIRQRVRNWPEHRRALREAELEEKPWLVPLRGSNESESRRDKNRKHSGSDYWMREHFLSLQHRYSGLIPGLSHSSFSQQQHVDLEAPPEAYIHTKDRRQTLREEMLARWSATKSRSSKFLERFILLPVEIRILILEHLEFGDIDRLRRTCRGFRMSISKPMIKAAFPYLSETLASTCRHCLGTDASSRLIIKTTYNYPQGAFKNQCWRCVSRRKDYKLDTRYEMVDETKGYFCRWCGYPVPRGAGVGHRLERTQYHNSCSRKRSVAHRWWFATGFFQWGLLLAACGMCWDLYHEYPMVIGFTILEFFVSIWGLLLTCARKPKLRTFHWALILKLIVLGFWIPPAYTISSLVRGPKGKLSRRAVATLVVIGINIVLHLVNAVGYLALSCEYQWWQRKRPGQNQIRRFFGKYLFYIVMFTWGNLFDLDYPAQWWPTRDSMDATGMIPIFRATGY